MDVAKILELKDQELKRIMINMLKALMKKVQHASTDASRKWTE